MVFVDSDMMQGRTINRCWLNPAGTTIFLNMSSLCRFFYDLVLNMADTETSLKNDISRAMPTVIVSERNRINNAIRQFIGRIYKAGHKTT